MNKKNKNMDRSVSFSIGNVALIDKINAQYGYFEHMFSGFYAKAENFIPTIKLFIANRLGKCVSVNRFRDVYPDEFFEKLDFLMPKSLEFRKFIYSL
ncbi:MAG: hypothetical protein U9Q69_04820 [Nanoarchaeota archaeon]|nr:hypothetical protein [Nanoarchaeota archaeon]